jgi:hypothetical protein
MKPNAEGHDFYRYADSLEWFFEFERVLKSYGINIAPGSDLERIGLNLTEILEKQRYPKLVDPYLDVRPYFSEVLGLSDFVRKIVEVKDHPDFKSLLPHLSLLNNSSLLQNVRSPVTDQGSNKIFEAYIGALAMKVGHNVRLDHPEVSKGDNPDVLLSKDGLEWGLACKVMHSYSGKTMFERFEEGIRQIEESVADTGVVIISVKNIIDYEKYLPKLEIGDPEKGISPIFASFLDAEIASRLLKREIRDIKNRLVKEAGTDLYETIRSRKVLPCLLMYCHIVISTEIDGTPFATSLKLFAQLNLGEISESARMFLSDLNEAMQDRV